MLNFISHLIMCPLVRLRHVPGGVGDMIDRLVADIKESRTRRFVPRSAVRRRGHNNSIRADYDHMYQVSYVGNINSNWVSYNDDCCQDQRKQGEHWLYVCTEAASTLHRTGRYIPYVCLDHLERVLTRYDM